mmetsp:Transcript_4108/g.13509  ORF Transcript_4108/g.13509 Transcript_4108/m.13509 type:complete len:305 (-) Transcript_4108:7795-8709(-)
MRAFRSWPAQVMDNSCGDAFKHVYRIAYDPSRKSSTFAWMGIFEVRLFAISNSYTAQLIFAPPLKMRLPAGFVESIINSASIPAVAFCHPSPSNLEDAKTTMARSAARLRNSSSLTKLQIWSALAGGNAAMIPSAMSMSRPSIIFAAMSGSTAPAAKMFATAEDGIFLIAVRTVSMLLEMLVRISPALNGSAAAKICDARLMASSSSVSKMARIAAEASSKDRYFKHAAAASGVIFNNIAALFDSDMFVKMLAAVSGVNAETISAASFGVMFPIACAATFASIVSRQSMHAFFDVTFCSASFCL